MLEWFACQKQVRYRFINIADVLPFSSSTLPMPTPSVTQVFLWHQAHSARMDTLALLGNWSIWRKAKQVFIDAKLPEHGETCHKSWLAFAKKNAWLQHPWPSFFVAHVGNHQHNQGFFVAASDDLSCQVGEFGDCRISPFNFWSVLIGTNAGRELLTSQWWGVWHLDSTWVLYSGLKHVSTCDKSEGNNPIYPIHSRPEVSKLPFLTRRCYCKRIDRPQSNIRIVSVHSKILTKQF